MQLRVPVTLALGFAWLSQPALAEPELAVSTVAARAEISLRTNGRQTRLPLLEFSVRAEFECDDQAVAESITISIADAHKRYAPNEDTDSLDALITVPANQIAPIVTGDFCVVGDDGSEELRLAGVATAQVSLRCRDASGSSVNFASLRLPLTLVCNRGADQVPSVPSVPSLPSPAR